MIRWVRIKTIVGIRSSETDNGIIVEVPGERLIMALIAFGIGFVMGLAAGKCN